ncbi:MAG TPA: hypothetical protein VJU15_08730 [Gemmatimonadales bacterium]|nr:hypothetical protein [Gemmatimonadales bacterium]
MITRIFWGLFALESGAFAVAVIYVLSRGSRGWGPEGPVGAWLLAIPPLVLIVLAATVLVRKTDGARLFGIVVMGVPLLQLAAGPVVSALKNRGLDRSLAGDDAFRKPAQRDLAHAIHAHDLALAKRLIPAAGDLNIVYNDETLLRFALVNADSSAASRQIVQALLDAGAKPDLTPGENSGNLVLAIPDPELTGMLLEAGADPNRIDSGDRPAWWNVLSDNSNSAFETLKLLLDHGADVTLRDRESGPVGWAAYHAWMSHISSWRMIQLLIERGAAWKEEQGFGRSVVDMFNDSFQERQRSADGVPEPMTWLKAKFAS